MLEKIKHRCGIHASIAAYDEDISDYIEDAILEMIDSGVPEDIAKSKDNKQVLTAITCYVKSFINDPGDSEKYMEAYRKKVFRLSLGGEENVE